MIMKMLYTLVLAFAVFVLVSQVNADPIQGVSARTQFFSGTAVRSFVRIIREANGDQNLHVVQIPTILGYNLATDAVVNLAVPYLIKELKTPDKRHLDARGVGDASLVGKYRFYREDVPRGSTQFAMLGGLELPTGDTTIRKDGVRLPPPLQLGSGAGEVKVKMKVDGMV